MTAATQVTEERPDSLPDKAGKYLTFALGNEHYGLEILKVREIIALMEITQVPLTPSYVRGVINLRGKIIPVVDLRAKFGMEPTADHDRKCVIVVDMVVSGQLLQMSILVDAVSEVVQIAGKDIGPPPVIGPADSGFILGMGKCRDRVKILLDIDSVLSSEDVVELNQLVSQKGGAAG